MQDSICIFAKHTEAFHRTVFVHMFEAVFSSIRSPHEKTSNTKVGVCHVLYKFCLETFSFWTSEREIRSAVSDSLKLENCHKLCLKFAQTSQDFHRTVAWKTSNTFFSMI